MNQGIYATCTVNKQEENRKKIKGLPPKVFFNRKYEKLSNGRVHIVQ